ncbi:ATP-binding protein [Paracoccaceae bacterium Fryx2]|nr:ATP-binding protein [Paracoccaceae bacterium Fryx2]
MAPGGTGGAQEGPTRIVIPSDPLAVRAALRTLFDTLLLRTMPEDDRSTAQIVLAEALNNIVEHAYANSHGEIEVTLSLQPTGLDCRIVDFGHPMPGGHPPDGSLPPIGPEDTLPEGGFGWHLIRSLSRDLNYDRVDGCNRLSFRLDTGRSGA